MGCVGSFINSNNNNQQNSLQQQQQQQKQKNQILNKKSTLTLTRSSSISIFKSIESNNIMPSSSKQYNNQNNKHDSKRKKFNNRSKKSIKFLTFKERTQIIQNCSIIMQQQQQQLKLSSSTKLLLSSPFSNFNRYTRRLFITGFAGIIPENLINNNIGFIVVLAKEMYNTLAIHQQDIMAEIYKFMLPESLIASIYDQFHTIIDLIDKKIRETNDKNVVVCCTSGMSRSSTIVIAYAIKHLGVSLKIAFQQLQQTRQCSRPNPNYFQQLIKFEHECLGENSITMIDICDNDEKQITSSAKSTKKILRLPDIYLESYPELLKYEKNIHNYLLQMNETMRKSQETTQEYTGELRPYIIEQVSYTKFFQELEALRQQQQPK